MKTMIRTLRAMLPLLAALTLPLLVMCGDDGNEIPGPTTPYCQQECSKADDCCKTPPCDQGQNAEQCLSGICKYVGCTSDADCTDPTGGMFAMTWKCEKAQYEGRTVGMCLPACTQDTDCPKIPILNIQLVCRSMTQYGQTFNMCAIPCKADADCAAMKLKCKDASYCDMFSSVAEVCKSDADCATRVGEKKCDVASGECTCESDQACIDGYKAIGSTNSYKCTK